MVVAVVLVVGIEADGVIGWVALAPGAAYASLEVAVHGGGVLYAVIVSGPLFSDESVTAGLVEAGESSSDLGDESVADAVLSVAVESTPDQQSPIDAQNPFVRKHWTQCSPSARRRSQAGLASAMISMGTEALQYQGTMFERAVAKEATRILTRTRLLGQTNIWRIRSGQPIHPAHCRVILFPRETRRLRLILSSSMCLTVNSLNRAVTAINSHVDNHKNFAQSPQDRAQGVWSPTAVHGRYQSGHLHRH